MIIDVSTQLDELISRIVREQISLLPISYPCKVKKIQDDGVFVVVETLMPKEDVDVERTIPIMQSPYLTLPIQEGDIGIALNCSFLFEEVMDDKKINEKQEANKENGLFFIPLVSKSGFKGKVGETMLSNKDHSSKISFTDNGIEIKVKDKGAVINDSKVELGDVQISQSQSPINITGQGGDLIGAFNLMVELMDLLASGMTGQTTAPTNYTAQKQAKIEALKLIVKG